MKENENSWKNEEIFMKSRKAIGKIKKFSWKIVNKFQVDFLTENF